MKLRVAIGESESDVDIRYDGGRARVCVDDRSYEVDVPHFDGDTCLLIYDGRVFDCRVDGPPDTGQAVGVVVGIDHVSATITDPKRLRSAASAGAHADGAIKIIAPMPGKVVRVLAEVGDQIEPGAGIAVVEAMKMQNEMKSPKAGTVVA